MIVASPACMPGRSPVEIGRALLGRSAMVYDARS
jgi:hypothetical protein